METLQTSMCDGSEMVVSESLKNGFIISYAYPLCDHSDYLISPIITRITGKINPRIYSHSIVPTKRSIKKAVIAMDLG